MPTISALSATPIIGLSQHYGVATLVGEAGGESKSAKWCRVVPRVVLVVVGVGVGVRVAGGRYESTSVTLTEIVWDEVDFMNGIPSDTPRAYV